MSSCPARLTLVRLHRAALGGVIAGSQLLKKKDTDDDEEEEVRSTHRVFASSL